MKPNGVLESPDSQGSLTTYARSVGYLRLHGLGDMTASFFAVLQPGLISQANGSAYIETERTKIACAVYVYCATAHLNLDNMLNRAVQVWSTSVKERGVQRAGPFECASEIRPVFLPQTPPLAVPHVL